MQRLTFYIIWLISLGALLTGLALTPGTVAALREMERELTAKARQLEALQNMADNLQRADAARLAFEQQFDSAPPTIEQVSNEALPGRRPVEIRRDSEMLLPGWTLLRREVSFEEINLPAVARLTRAAQQTRPPWMLRRCVIRASSQTRGRGDAVLVFETIAPEE